MNDLLIHMDSCYSFIEWTLERSFLASEQLPRYAMHASLNLIKFWCRTQELNWISVLHKYEMLIFVQLDRCGRSYVIAVVTFKELKIKTVEQFHLSLYRSAESFTSNCNPFFSFKCIKALFCYFKHFSFTISI